MSRIFISYSREDGEFVQKLAKSLKDNKIEIWIDVFDIPAGMKWDNAIETALMSATHVLFVLSKSSAASENVRDELDYARQKRKKIVPVRIDDSDPPFRMGRLNYIDFSGDNYDEPLARLLRDLRGLGLSSEGVTDPQMTQKYQPFSEEDLLEVLDEDKPPAENKGDAPAKQPQAGKMTTDYQDIAQQVIYDVLLPNENRDGKTDSTRSITAPLNSPMLHISTPQTQKTWKMTGHTLLIGRGDDCDIMITSTAVSRHHARINRTMGQFYLEDLNSRNGTMVNGKPVSDARQELYHGDEIELAFRVKIRFELHVV